MEEKTYVSQLLSLCVAYRKASRPKQMEAAQKFLRGVVALSSFSEMREKQWRGVSKSLEKVAVLTPAQAAEWLAAFDGELWTAAQVAEYQASIAEKTKALEEQPMRGTGQDFLMLPYYLTEELATMVLAGEDLDRDALLQKLCYHASKLTLRNASEASKAMLLVLANWRAVCKMSPQDQYQFYLNKEHLVTKYLSSALAGGQALPGLPMCWQELPSANFPMGKPAVLSASIASEMVQVVRNYPLRKDNKLLVSQSKGMAAQVAASTPAQAASSTDRVSVVAVCKVVEAV